MQVMQSKENSGSARFMAIYLGGDGYRWHPAGQSNPIKRELHLLQHDQPTSAGRSRETQEVGFEFKNYQKKTQKMLNKTEISRMMR